jgi:hypothetical protein
MTRVIKRALPFLITFILGVVVSAIIGTVWPTHRKTTFIDNGRGCYWRARAELAPGRFVATHNDYTVVEVWEMPDTATTLRIPFTMGGSYSSRLSLKEQALFFRGMERGYDRDFVVSYVSPEAMDGNPVTSNAIVSYIPRPLFWSDERSNDPSLDCNALVRVDLDASGSVSNAGVVSGYGNKCPYLGDILDAAKQITFHPALRNGVPVSERMSLMYRLH